jgi:hypothetical protein
MGTHARLSVAAVAALAGSLILSGCGGSTVDGTGTKAATTVPASAPATSGPAVTAPATSGPATSGPATSAAPPPSTTAALTAIVLQTADVPSGWTGTPNTPDPGEAATQAALVACVGGKDVFADQIAEVHSDDFNLSTASLSSQASKFRSQADVDADVSILNSPKISNCYEVLLRKELATGLPAGATLGAVTVHITPGQGGGPSNIAGTGTGTIAFSANGASSVVYVAVAFITGPLIEAEVDAENVGVPVPAAVFTQAVTTVAGRAAKG